MRYYKWPAYELLIVITHVQITYVISDIIRFIAVFAPNQQPTRYQYIIMQRDKKSEALLKIETI